MISTDLKKLIGQRIKERREALGLSNTDLATRAAMGWRNLYFIQGGRGISVPALLKLAVALDVSMDWLCGRDEVTT